MSFFDDLVSGITKSSPFNFFSRSVPEVGTDILGLSNTQEQREAFETAQNLLGTQGTETSNAFNEAMRAAAAGHESVESLIGPESMAYYKQMVGRIDPESVRADLSPLRGFEFDRDVSKYMDPNADYQIQKGTEAAMQAMAGQGGMSGGAAARALQAQASADASKLYGDAFDRMMRATGQEYQQARDVVSADQAGRQARASMEQFKTGEYGKLADALLENEKGNYEDYANLVLGKAGTNLGIAQALAQMRIDQSATPTWMQQALGSGGNLIGSALKGLIG